MSLLSRLAYARRWRIAREIMALYGVEIPAAVKIGRADAYVPGAKSMMTGVEIQDDVVLFPGARVLGRVGKLVVARGTIVAANAVLLRSTGPDEIWGGIPARKIGMRLRDDALPEHPSSA
jgi:serine O-acetyltransferase